MRILAAVGPERSPTLPGTSHPARVAGLVLRALGVHLRCPFSGQWSGRVVVLCGCATVSVCAGVCACMCTLGRSARSCVYPCESVYTCIRVHMCLCMHMCSCVHVYMCIWVCVCGSPGMDWGGDQAGVLG